MRAILWLAVALTALEWGGDARGQGAKPDPERDWAGRLAKDFLQAVTGDTYLEAISDAVGLLSPEAARAHDADPLNSFVVRAAGYRTAEIVGTEAAPDRTEFILTGKLKGYRSQYRDGTREVEFVMRVAKEGGGGRWSIRSMRIGKPVGPTDR